MLFNNGKSHLAQKVDDYKLLVLVFHYLPYELCPETSPTPPIFIQVPSDLMLHPLQLLVSQNILEEAHYCLTAMAIGLARPIKEPDRLLPLPGNTW